jgi:transposase
MNDSIILSDLVPPDFILTDVCSDTERIELILQSKSRKGACPDCGIFFASIHSRYVRTLADLPASGRSVLFRIDVRRFRCRHSACQRWIFAERFDATIVAPWARRTSRLNVLFYHLGLALGGRPAARFADRLMTPVSNDTLLRTIRRKGRPDFTPPKIVGIDDWAWHRNQRYGTIVCDLERRHPIRLLPDREPATTQALLAEQSQIAIIARDRGGGYGTGSVQGLSTGHAASRSLAPP